MQATYRLIPENFPFAPAGVTWARYAIRPATSNSADVSAVMRRREGWLWVQIFVPESKGTADANRVSDLLAAMFDETILVTADSTVIFRRAELGYVTQEESGWQQWRCLIPYREDSAA